MYSRHLIKFFLLIPICIGCSNYPDKPPKDFSFQLINDVDSYNSENGYFIRKAINDKFKDTTVVYILSQKDKEEIYKVLKDNDVFSIPKEFQCSSDAKFMIPSFNTTFRFQIAGFKNEIKFNTGCFPKKNLDDEVKFDNITKFIFKKLRSNEAIKNLPKTKMVFM